MSIATRVSQKLRRAVIWARRPAGDFALVTNNCWGAHLYQSLGRPYQTPFVGLFLAPACYVNLVPRLRWYLGQPVRFLEKSRHEAVNGFRAEHQRKHGYAFPIGLLGDDVEIQFMHYHSEAEAADKWARRIERMPKGDDRVFFKFDDRDGCTPEQVTAFDAAPVAHKVCFVRQPVPGTRHTVLIESAAGGELPDGLALTGVSPKYFDALDWVNGGDGRPKWWRPVRL